jgi:thioredoxin-related protein
MRIVGRLTAILLFLLANVYGQDQGIQFEKDLTWDQVLAKAKAENKHVFVDCYATWCGPCKAMDKNIYPVPEVGDYFNQHFVSVKIQMDKTPKDDETTRRWHKEAEKLKAQYQVVAFPTFLFFSSDGQLVHKGLGGYEIDGFLDLANTALNPKMQYYKLLADFNERKIDPSLLKSLSRMEYKFGNQDNAKKIAKYYIDKASLLDLITKDDIGLIKFELGNDSLANEIGNSYLKTLNDSDLYTRENIVFLRDTLGNIESASRYLHAYIKKMNIQNLLTKENIPLMVSLTRRSTDTTFQIIYKNARTINKIMDRPNYSEIPIEYIIAKEEIDPVLNHLSMPNSNPHWGKLESTISKKYNSEYADRATLLAQSWWYGYKKDKERFINSKVEYVKKYGNSMSNFEINNDFAWPVFLNSENKEILNYAATKMAKVITEEPEFYPAIDTYANLLYKLGKTKEAIKWQKMITEKDPDHVSYKEKLDKMLKGIPTWPPSE